MIKQIFNLPKFFFKYSHVCLRLHIIASLLHIVLTPDRPATRHRSHVCNISLYNCSVGSQDAKCIEDFTSSSGKTSPKASNNGSNTKPINEH